MKKSNLIPITLTAALAGIFILLLIVFGNIYIWENKSTPKELNTGAKELSDYYNQARQLGTKQPTLLTTTFSAVGDISLSRNIAQTIKKSGNTDAPFLNIAETLLSVDFNFGNFETPFSESDAFTPKDTLIFNAPKANVFGLVKYKFKVLNLANNHALDQNLSGMRTTKKILENNNILHIGTGETLDEAWQPAIYESNAIKIGFIGASYASINDGGKTINNYVARIEDTKKLASIITDLKPKVDFIVATMHAGNEYTRTPNQGQTTFAHAAIDSGADMVIGAHSHWIQTIEQYKGKHIFYSLGNFIFDQSWSQETTEGLLLKISLTKSGTPNGGKATLEDIQGSRTSATVSRIELIPLVINDNCCPREALSVESQEILKKIGVTNSILTP